MGNAQQPLNPAGKTYHFLMQQLEYKFFVGHARQPVNHAVKTYNFGK